MDYRQAVNLAKAGKEEGFQFLYESTYKSKYYLALKYLKDEQAAQDVLQEAYIKAFAKLDSLEQPEQFPAWLGVIVGNLAKNKLQKKNPLLFSDIAVNDEDESFAYEIEDENPNYQPELSYSKQETQQLVHEMINALSEEQRVCILMYEIEGIPIREIAAALGCSENTVKSRLNYGRKNLKKKAEELQKRGYKLYGVSALPLLLWLLRREESDLLADGVLEMAQSRAAGQIFSHAGTEETFGAKAADAARNVWESGRTAAAGAAKKGFLHTVAGKVTAVLVGLAVVGGAAGTAYTVYSIGSRLDELPFHLGAEQSSAVSTAAPETSTAPQEATPAPTAEPSPTPEAPQVREMAEADYPALIAGDLTKAEVEYVLAYGPEEITEQGLEQMDYVNALNTLCQGPEGSGMASTGQVNPIESYGHDSQYRSEYSVADVNRLFRSFTDYQFTEENHGANEWNIQVVGESICFFPATINFTAETNIVAAEYTDEEMTLYFTYDRHLYDMEFVDTHAEKRAILRPNAEGKYQIVRIEEAEIEVGQEPAQETAPPASADEQSVDTAYAGVLDSVKNGERAYQFTDGLDYTGAVKYFYQDLNQDGIKDLVIGAECTQGPFMAMDCKFYSCQEQNGGYQLVEVPGSQIVTELCLPQDGYGVFTLEYSRGTGMYECSRITLENNAIKLTDMPEYRFQLGDSAQKAFAAANPDVVWIDLI